MGDVKQQQADAEQMLEDGIRQQQVGRYKQMNNGSFKKTSVNR